jgi:ABC-type molybdate transport system substrate-binding protein
MTNPRSNRPGRVNGAFLAFLASAAVLAVLLALLTRDWWGRWFAPAEKRALVVYCAAGLRPPVEEAARRYQEAYGVEVQLRYDSSGKLLGAIQASGQGDLYIPADDGFLRTARDKNLVRETLPLARMRPVLSVHKGNPKNLHSLADLLGDKVRLSHADDRAAIGKVVTDALKEQRRWADLEKHVAVNRQTVSDVANDVAAGSVDAGFVWDAVASQNEELEAVELPELAGLVGNVNLGVLSCCEQPSAALRFARFLAARDRGLPLFKEKGYEPADGDPWAETPELRLAAGAMLRPAITDTLDEFEKREGVRVFRDYNGCGILVSEMRTVGKSPDAYFACDQSFMSMVHDLFLEPTEVSSNRLVILVPKGNPHHIRSLEDLGQPGLRVGVGHERKCALGQITQKTLEQNGALAPVMKNVLENGVLSPTGDQLVNQLQTKSLDAVVAYVSNAKDSGEEFEAIPVDVPCAVAVQPVAVGKDSAYPQLTRRLLDALRSPESRRRFEQHGFVWREGAK